MTPTNDVTLVIAGQPFTGWTGVEIARSLDDLADTWSLQAITRWAVTSDPDLAIRIDEGDAVEFKWGKLSLITGYIDEIAEDLAPDSWSVSLAGRSRAGDLVDCSALAKGAWTSRSAVEIAKDLCDPFGITAITTHPELAKPIKRFAVNGDETVAEALRRLAATAGLRIVSTPAGDIDFAAPAAAPVVASQSLRFGRNVRNVRRARNAAERFSDYVLRVQLPCDDERSGAAAVIAASVQDAQVGRYRPLRLPPERSAGADELKRRSEWERNTRAGRSDKVEVEVYDGTRTWLAGPGLMWAPGQLVPVAVDHLELDAQLLIESVALGYGAGGYTARLSLVHPEAYQPEVPPKAKKKKGAMSW